MTALGQRAIGKERAQYPSKALIERTVAAARA